MSGEMQTQAQAQPSMGQPRLAPMRVEDVIQTDVVTATQDASVASVVELMDQHNVGTVVVVDDNQSPIGIVTDRKIALALGSKQDIADRPVEEIISGTLVTGTVEMSLPDVLERLRDEEIRRIPIVGDDGTLQGIVSLDDLLIVLCNQFDDAIGVVEAQIR